MDKKVILVIIFGLACFGMLSWHYRNTASLETQIQQNTQPVPDSISLEQRTQLKYPKGDVKYRVVYKPVVTIDSETGWDLYQSREYGFTFVYPPEMTIDSTESLGFQLPKELAYKGSRDNFEITLSKKNGAVFFMYLNNPEFSATGTLTSTTTVTSNGLTYTKEIYAGTDSGKNTSEIITYRTAKNSYSFAWYGAMNEKDVESINQFESVVTSFKFTK